MLFHGPVDEGWGTANKWGDGQPVGVVRSYT